MLNKEAAVDSATKKISMDGTNAYYQTIHIRRNL